VEAATTFIALPTMSHPSLDAPAAAALREGPNSSVRCRKVAGRAGRKPEGPAAAGALLPRHDILEADNAAAVAAVAARMEDAAVPQLPVPPPLPASALDGHKRKQRLAAAARGPPVPTDGPANPAPAPAPQAAPIDGASTSCAAVPSVARPPSESGAALLASARLL